jgi:uncharacterized phage-like protein YoqJ
MTGSPIYEWEFGFNEREPSCIKLKLDLLQGISELYAMGYRDFYTSAELGVPLWAGEAVLALKLYCPDIQLHIIQPYENQASRWPEEYRERFFSLHEKSDSSRLLYTRMNDRCYQEAMDIMLEESESILVCTPKDQELTDLWSRYPVKNKTVISGQHLRVYSLSNTNS